MNAKITHIEYYLPEKVVTNSDLVRENPDWDFKRIESKTGVISRHIAGKDERASGLAIRAAEQLFEKNKIDRKSVDTLIFCTQSPDHVLPTTACVIQDKLGLLTDVAAFDFNLGCSGYIYGLAITGSMINSGISKRALLLCGETYSKIILPDDRTARTVFGDGAAATLIESSRQPGMLGPFVLGTDGKGIEKIFMGVEPRPHIHIDGPAVFMFTMNKVPICVNELLVKAQMKLSDIDLFIFHQASKVVIDNIVRILSLDENKVFRGYEKTGNTVSASIPIALKQAIESERVKKGDLIMLVGFGVGYSWGASLVRWEGEI